MQACPKQEWRPGREGRASVPQQPTATPWQKNWRWYQHSPCISYALQLRSLWWGFFCPPFLRKLRQRRGGGCRAKVGLETFSTTTVLPSSQLSNWPITFICPLHICSVSWKALQLHSDPRFWQEICPHCAAAPRLLFSQLDNLFTALLPQKRI